MLVKLNHFSLHSFIPPKQIVIGFSALFVAAMAWNLRRHSHDSLFHRICETLPGPFLFSSSSAEERRALRYQKALTRL